MIDSRKNMQLRIDPRFLQNIRECPRLLGRSVLIVGAVQNQHMRFDFPGKS